MEATAALDDETDNRYELKPTKRPAAFGEPRPAGRAALQAMRTPENLSAE